MSDKKTDNFEEWFSSLTELVEKAFSDTLTVRKMPEENISEEEVESKDSDAIMDVPQSISEYTELTGKRFRMTKAQKEFGMSREEAFEEFINNWSVGKKTN